MWLLDPKVAIIDQVAIVGNRTLVALGLDQLTLDELAIRSNGIRPSGKSPPHRVCILVTDYFVWYTVCMYMNLITLIIHVPLYISDFGVGA